MKTNGMTYGFFVFFLVALSAFGSFVNDMYQPSLPAMVHYFHTSVPTVQMGLTMGMLGLAIGQFILGPVSDKYGRKPGLIYALALFIVAAVVSVYSPSIHFFLACRLFQGIGASAAYFLARTVPADIFMGRQLAKTMAVIGAINGFAPASAPVLGGLIADAWSWKAVFWILAGAAVCLICITPFFKESLPKDKRIQGSLSSAFRRYGPLLKNRRFMTHVMLKGTALGLLFAYVSACPFIMEDHFGFSQTKFGLIMGGNAIFVAAGSMIALRFKVLKQAAWIGAIGLLITTLAESAALYFHPDFWTFELLLILMIFAMGMIFTVSNTLAMNEGRAEAGTASAILGIVGYIFGGVLAPVVGMGDIFHSTAIVFTVQALLVLIFAYLSKRLPADLENDA